MDAMAAATLAELPVLGPGHGPDEPLASVLTLGVRAAMRAHAPLRRHRILETTEHF